MTIRVPKWVVGALALIAAGGLGAGIAVLAGGDNDRGESPDTVTTQPSLAPETEPNATTTPSEAAAAAGVADCDDLRRTGGEGNCQNEPGSPTRDDPISKVVNRDTSLQLEELKVDYLGHTTSEVLTDVGVTRADGVFVVVELAVTNKLPQPVYFSESQTQTGLTISPRSGRSKFYSEDFDAENGGDRSSFTWKFEEIQPDNTSRGTVIFDVPPQHVSEIERSGNLIISNFSDVDRNRPRLPLGFIRLYPPKS